MNTNEYRMGAEADNSHILTSEPPPPPICKVCGKYAVDGDFCSEECELRWSMTAKWRE